MGSIGVSSKIDTTWSATQVCPRPVESCLGGHEAGVFGDDDGVEKTSLPVWKLGPTALSECATFSDFSDVNDFSDGKPEDKNLFRQSRDTL